MQRFTLFLATTILVITTIPACAPQQNQVDTSDHNALIIQADFPGHVMSGVAYNVSKDLDIFNIRPLIPLYDIKSASDSLTYNAQTWPAGTVFVSVVDPGVGTDRKSVVLETSNGLFFVSPDNGSLSGPAARYGIRAVREIDESVNRRPGTDWSHTFHGRDVYSYTGARLAAAVITFEQVGPLMEPKVIMLDELSGKFENETLYGFVIGGTERLGNIYFSVDRQLFENIKPVFGELFDITIRNENVVIWQESTPYTKSFGDVPLGNNLMFMNSSGNLSLAINQGNFAQQFKIETGENWTIKISRHPAQ